MAPRRAGSRNRLRHFELERKRAGSRSPSDVVISSPIESCARACKRAGGWLQDPPASDGVPERSSAKGRLPCRQPKLESPVPTLGELSRPSDIPVCCESQKSDSSHRLK